jgi:hypothetical protein
VHYIICCMKSEVSLLVSPALKVLMLRLLHLRPDLYKVLDAAPAALEAHASYMCTKARQARSNSLTATHIQVYLRLQHSPFGCLSTMEDFQAMLNLSSVECPLLITLHGQVIKLSSVHSTSYAQMRLCKVCR